jgi:hypothetical protein
MSLSDIFSGAFFRTPEERKATDLIKFQRKLEWLAQDDRVGVMLENEMGRADATDGQPRPVKIEMVFKNLVPADITAEMLAGNPGFAYLQFLAEDAEAKLTFEVTAQKQRPYFWQDGKDAADCAKVTIIIDLNQPHDASRIFLAEAAAVKAPAPLAAPGHSDTRARP